MGILLGALVPVICAPHFTHLCLYVEALSTVWTSSWCSGVRFNASYTPRMASSTINVPLDSTEQLLQILADCRLQVLDFDWLPKCDQDVPVAHKVHPGT